MDSVLVQNTSEFELPTKIEMSEGDIRVARRLEQRAHLTSYDPNTHMDPLTAKEETAFVEYRRALVRAAAPRWGGFDFKFAKAGEQGSVWELPIDIANFLVKQMRKGGNCLRIIPADEACSITPVWRPLPTDSELAFKGFKSEADLEPVDRMRGVHVGAAAGMLSKEGLTKMSPSGLSADNAG